MPCVAQSDRAVTTVSCPRCAQWVVPPTGCPEGDERDGGNRGHACTFNNTLYPQILAEPSHAILPGTLQATRVRHGEYATDATLEERDEPTKVVAKPISALEVGRPLRVLSLSEEQAWSVDMETQHVRLSTIWQRHLQAVTGGVSNGLQEDTTRFVSAARHSCRTTKLDCSSSFHRVQQRD